VERLLVEEGLQQEVQGLDNDLSAHQRVCDKKALQAEQGQQEGVRCYQNSVQVQSLQRTKMVLAKEKCFDEVLSECPD